MYNHHPLISSIVLSTVLGITSYLIWYNILRWYNWIIQDLANQYVDAQVWHFASAKAPLTLFGASQAVQPAVVGLSQVTRPERFKSGRVAGRRMLTFCWGKVMCLNDPTCILNPYPKVPESSCVYRYWMTTWQLCFFASQNIRRAGTCFKSTVTLPYFEAKDMVCCQHCKNGILNLSNEGKSRYVSMPSFIYRLFDISALVSLTFNALGGWVLFIYNRILITQVAVANTQK